MNVFTELPVSPATATSQTIPYRTESPISAAKALSVFGLTVALLAAAVGVLLWGRRRGWLRPWLVPASSSSQERRALRVLGQIRLGQASQAFLIEADGSRLVVVESSRQVSLHALRDGRAISGERDE